jgi:hypothetical protein
MKMMRLWFTSPPTEFYLVYLLCSIEKYGMIIQKSSVVEPVHFSAAPASAPDCQKFRLRLQLVKNFSSGCKLNFKFKYEKFRAFCNILYEFTYPEPELAQKTSTSAPPKICRNSGSGSATLPKSGLKNETKLRRLPILKYGPVIS